MPGSEAYSANTYSSLNRVQVIRGGKEYFDLLLQLINQATESIHLQTYIYDDDETGQLIANALIAAVKRNVQVHLLADGYASQGIGKKLVDIVKESGIHFRFFEPLLKSKHFYFGRRLHHKVFVADAKYSLVGGMNISDRYNDMPAAPAWLDFALYAEGEIAKDLCVLCWKTWNSFRPNMGITPCEKKELQFQFTKDETSKVRMRRNDWVRGKNEISATYIEMFRNAKSHITIICSYFLPGKVIRRLLKSAAERGVKIKLITTGQSDIKMAKYAERWMYDWLLRNHIELYEYQPSVLHAKVAMCDGEWFTLGSYNINNISTYASIELNLDVYNSALTQNLEQFMNDLIQQNCIAITKEKHVGAKNMFKQFVRWFSYQFIKMGVYLFTFYFEKIKKGIS